MYKKRDILYNLLFFLLLFVSVEIFAYVVNEEKEIVVVIPSYNNKNWYERNLTSVLSQDYSRFHVIYTDDCSPDGTGDLVEAYLAEHDTEKRVTLIKNKERLGALHNLYKMIHLSSDDVIIATLDGDDWFPDDNVLKQLNEIYSLADVWLTYGQFKMYPSGVVGWTCAIPEHVIETNSFRAFQHLPSHLRTFYAWLFKRIKLEDFLYLGDFYCMSWDMVMMFPMIEMAGERHRFISDIMYIYNEGNSISDHRVSRQLQAHMAQIVKGKRPYDRLIQKPSFVVDNQLSKTDCIVFYNRDMRTLELFFDSLHEYVQGIDKIFVLYQVPRSEQDQLDDFINKYSDIVLYQIDEHRSNFRQAFIDVYNNSTSPFTLFAKADVIFTMPIDLNECIQILNTTQAYAFYFKLAAGDRVISSEYLPMIFLDEDKVAWDFSLARGAWSCANSLDLVLHRKMNSLFNVMNGYFDLTPEGFEAVWANEGMLNKVGICFKENHIEKIV